VTKLGARLVEKPWGCSHLRRPFGATGGRRIGELWFEGPDDAPLLAKYIFTSERLSIQVHPNDEQASARGLPRGKSECWYIVDAEPGATIGLGLVRETGADELRAAALDGSIEQLLEWRPITGGDFFLVPAGTIHAIGAGISLFEFQQNSDITYRLYDYGRPRELHLDEAIAVANRAPYSVNLFRKVEPDSDAVLVDGPSFRLVHTHSDAMTDRMRWVMPLAGSAVSGGDIAEPGECLLLGPGETIESRNARMLIGATA
jgi:mannose-6-phosphate isomerase